MTASPRMRCAVYTRKSTEDGLEQEFNSLDAQREACEAYIRSQSSLGWKLVSDRYDDGGISGGTMDRPALQRLLQHIRGGQVDVVVVYKIDRLTRSLSDFARIVDVFDEAKASFVSVTQQFNTTTSMGRLTLNVLLSFAQFEREVTAERIRDKIAASKKKGMWMGGGVPLGYRAENRKLKIDEQEAGIVRFLFNRYLELKSVRALAAEANAKRFPARSTRRPKAPEEDSFETPASSGSAVRHFGRGPLYHLLSNPTYIGKVRHRQKIYEGEHEAIISAETFAAAQALLSAQAPVRSSATNAADIHLLTGILFDEEGTGLRSVHTKKGNVRYRYYVSKACVEERGKSDRNGWRLPARQIEQVVEDELANILTNPRRMSHLIADQIPADRFAAAIDQASALYASYKTCTPQHQRDLVRQLFPRIELTSAKLILRFDAKALAELLVGNASVSDAENDRQLTSIERPISLRRRGKETKIVLTDSSGRTSAPDENLIQILQKAHSYLAQLTDGSGRRICEVAAANGIDRSDFSRVLRLAFLAPKITGQILSGSQPPELTAQKLSRMPELPHAWSQQQRLLGC
ncbi:recombinase family protein [Nitratireductor mangrovi]|uniref:Recombinase family protein n=1 Tax=Nitratireductor mangrovi TaxID=2599600 RepID=A0A5B8L006_9HYPH|nr:recombinase family protein [Nitratireductor mangrovi]QDZ01337.2 recombinase family protein [Nitratireductor mangrovi]